MLIIAYEPGVTVGGYGDRILGLISVFVMAQRLKRPFKILWTKEPFRQYVDYTAFDAERVDTKNPLPPYIHRVYAIDDPNILRRYLETERGPLFPHAACKFILNLEVARFLYTNPRFAAKRDDYLSDMLAAYRLLYSLFLVPRPHIRAAAEAVVADPDGRPCVGIQIRAGDVYMRYGGSHTVLKDPATIVPAMLAAVKSHVDASAGWGDSYTVFVTSDWSGALEAARCVWSQDRVFYNNDAIQHIDRPVEGDFSKVYVDNWILATKTARLYITACSNYGRVAALAAPHDAVYDVGTLALLAKKDLLSKS
jgi:hypothetical protein